MGDIEEVDLVDLEVDPDDSEFEDEDGEEEDKDSLCPNNNEYRELMAKENKSVNFFTSENKKHFCFTSHECAL